MVEKPSFELYSLVQFGNPNTIHLDVRTMGPFGLTKRVTSIRGPLGDKQHLSIHLHWSHIFNVVLTSDVEVNTHKLHKVHLLTKTLPILPKSQSPPSPTLRMTIGLTFPSTPVPLHVHHVHWHSGRCINNRLLQHTTHFHCIVSPLNSPLGDLSLAPRHTHSCSLIWGEKWGGGWRR